VDTTSDVVTGGKGRVSAAGSGVLGIMSAGAGAGENFNSTLYYPDPDDYHYSTGSGKQHDKNGNGGYGSHSAYMNGSHMDGNGELVTNAHNEVDLAHADMREMGDVSELLEFPLSPLKGTHLESARSSSSNYKGNGMTTAAAAQSQSRMGVRPSYQLASSAAALQSPAIPSQSATDADEELTMAEV